MSQLSDSKMVTRLAGRSALITGASRGIGFAIAKSFAMQGANVVLSATSETGLKKAKEILDQYGVDVSYLAADVSDSQQIDNLFSFAINSRNTFNLD